MVGTSHPDLVMDWRWGIEVGIIDSVNDVTMNGVEPNGKVPTAE